MKNRYKLEKAVEKQNRCLINCYIKRIFMTTNFWTTNN